jgi:hypothetical protein
MKKVISKYLLSTLLLLSTIPTLYGQDKPKYFERNNYIDLALGAGKDIYTGSLSWSHLHPLGKKKQRFSIGYGLRFTSAFGSNKDYITAPARLTSKQEGPQVLFSETFNENLDTLRVSSIQMNSFNISINLQYNITPKFSVGANIDALGFSFGQGVNGKYVSSISADNNSLQSASPTVFNLLLVSDNDLGMLNSEFYVKYNISEKIGIRAGYEFTFTEYTTNKKLTLDNDRFRAKHQMLFVAVTWHLFKKQK